MSFFFSFVDIDRCFFDFFLTKFFVYFAHNKHRLLTFALINYIMYSHNTFHNVKDKSEMDKSDTVSRSDLI